MDAIKFYERMKELSGERGSQLAENFGYRYEHFCNAVGERFVLAILELGMHYGDITQFFKEKTFDDCMDAMLEYFHYAEEEQGCTRNE